MAKAKKSSAFNAEGKTAYACVLIATIKTGLPKPGPPRSCRRTTRGAWTYIDLDDGLHEFHLSYCGPHLMLRVELTLVSAEERRLECALLWLYTRERWALMEYTDLTRRIRRRVLAEKFGLD